jgi:hypothetical protein
VRPRNRASGFSTRCDRAPESDRTTLVAGILGNEIVQSLVMTIPWRLEATSILNVVLVACSLLWPSAALGSGESPSVSDLVAKGAPSPDREWSANDYDRFAATLREIAATDSKRLPRFESEASAPLLKRVVTDANVSIGRDEKFPLPMRVGEIIKMTQSLGAIMVIYMEATNQGGGFDRELVELTAFMVGLNVEHDAIGLGTGRRRSSHDIHGAGYLSSIRIAAVGEVDSGESSHAGRETL